MIRPIEPNSSLIYAQSEFFQEEADTRRRRRRALASCVVTISSKSFRNRRRRCETTETLLVRSCRWNSACARANLRRSGTADYRRFLLQREDLGSSTTASLPSRIEITRPQDQYKLSISYQDSASVELNREFDPKAFVLENKWELPEVDLDAQNKKVTAINKQR